MRDQKLEAKEGEDGTLDELHQFVNLFQESSHDLDVGKLLHKVGGVVIVLGEQAQRDCCHWIVAPAPIQRGEKAPALLGINNMKLCLKLFGTTRKPGIKVPSVCLCQLPYSSLPFVMSVQGAATLSRGEADYLV